MFYVSERSYWWNTYLVTHTKWSPFFRRHFQIWVLVQRLFYFDSYFTTSCSQWSNQQYISIGSDNGYAQKSDKPIYKSMMTSSNEKQSALLALCAGNSPVTGEFPSQSPVTQSFDDFFDLRLNKQLRKQSWGWWFETLSCSWWRHCNVMTAYFTGAIPLNELTSSDTYLLCL